MDDARQASGASSSDSLPQAGRAVGDTGRVVGLPDWKGWLAANLGRAAASSGEYELHLAAHEWSLASALDVRGREDLETLRHLAVEPFDHQIQNAILFFRRLAPRALVADEVGLGKTITAGLIAAELLQRGRIESLLVACPESRVDRWREELENTFRITARTAVADEFDRLESHPFWITTYAAALRRLGAIRTRGFDLLVLDEAHRLGSLRGHDRRRPLATEFAKLMKRDGPRFALLLTATPIRDSLRDIYGLLELLGGREPNPLGTPDEFERVFMADPDARHLREGVEAEFRRRVARRAVRTRRKDTPLRWPERAVRDRVLKPLPGEKEYLDHALEVILRLPSRAQAAHTRSLLSSPWALAASLERALEASGVPAALRPALRGLAEAGRAIEESAKTRAVVKLARELAKRKGARRVIVFAMRTETLEHLAAAVERAGFAGQVALVEAREADSGRRAAQDLNPPRHPILLSTDANAAGLDLPASSVVVNYDLPWDPLLIERRIGRVERVGPGAARVEVHNLVLQATTEDRVVRRLMQALRVFDQPVGETEARLELSGYDGEECSVERVVMDLIRKTDATREVEEDIQRIEERTRAAVIRLKEMQEANERALGSLRVPDAEMGPAGLARVTPRMPFPELVEQCRQREGAGSLRVGDGPLIARDSRAFELVTERAREEASHHILDATGVGLARVQATLEEKLAPLGMVLDGLRPLARTPALAARLALEVTAEVASDRYETLIERECADPSDGVSSRGGEIARAGGPDGEPLPRSTRARVREIGDLLQALAGVAQETAEQHESVRKFCGFYQARYGTALEKLADQVRAKARDAGPGDAEPGDPGPGDAESVVRKAAGTDGAVRAEYETIRSCLVPHVTVALVGVSGLQYTRAEIEARVRHRSQHEAFPVRVVAVPLTGVVLSDLPVSAALGSGGEGWACRGGHVVAASEFLRCAASGCTVGTCQRCSDSAVEGATLCACSECETPCCGKHHVRCRGCGRTFCQAHAALVRAGAAGCQRCPDSFGQGRLALEGEATVSPVSVPAASEPGGWLVLPEDMAADDLTGEPVPSRLLLTCAETGTRTLAGNLVVSSVTGKRVLAERTARCAESGRLALPHELRACALTGRVVHPDLLFTCPETGSAVLRRLGEPCEATGALAAPAGLGTCEATGKRVRRSLLATDEVTGRTVQAALLRSCERTGRRTLGENLVRSAVSGATVLAGIAAQCEVSGAAALPEELEVCAVTGKRVLPALLEECAVSRRRVLQPLLRACEVTGTRVLPDHLERCSRTGKLVLSSLLGTSELSGDRGLVELLAACEATGRKVFADELVTSATSGKRVGRDRAVACPQCSRVADLSECASCAICGRHSCRDDQLAEVCRACAGLLSHGAGRPLHRREIETLQLDRPWIRRGWVVELPGLLYVDVAPGLFRVLGRSLLLIFARRKGQAIEDDVDAPVAERPVSRDARARARRLWKRMRFPSDPEGRGRALAPRARRSAATVRPRQQ